MIQRKFYNVNRNKTFLLIGHIESLLNEFEWDLVIREAACNFHERNSRKSPGVKSRREIFYNLVARVNNPEILQGAEAQYKNTRKGWGRGVRRWIAHRRWIILNPRSKRRRKEQEMLQGTGSNGIATSNLLVLFRVYILLE